MKCKDNTCKLDQAANQSKRTARAEGQGLGEGCLQDNLKVNNFV